MPHDRAFCIRVLYVTNSCFRISPRTRENENIVYQNIRNFIDLVELYNKISVAKQFSYKTIFFETMLLPPSNDTRLFENIKKKYFNKGSNIQPFNFRNTSCAASILRKRFVVVYSYSETKSKRDTVTWKINVRGIAHIHRCTELVLTAMPYFFDAANIRRAW